MVKSPNVQFIQNVPLAAELIIQRRNVGAVPELTFVPKGIDRTPKTQRPPKTKAPSLKSKNVQHLRQANRTQRNLIQETNFATTPNM